MSWELVLSEDDLASYKRNISLLEERVVQNFPDIYRNPAILSALRAVPRHLFVNQGYKTLAYADCALPTLGGLTTSAPSVIARMIFHAGVVKGSRVLEIGTGTGYQTAVLSEMGARVFTIEIDRSVAETAAAILARLGYKMDRRSTKSRQESARRYLELRRIFPGRGHVEVFWGNGGKGMAAKAPFDAIIIAASVSKLDQLSGLAPQLSARDGRMVVPVGPRHDQTLTIVERNGERFHCSLLEGISFDFLRFVIGKDST
ncbi:MAG: protein-L-isoaspartate O-methyltransferase [Spirochaetia bacterium]